MTSNEDNAFSIRITYVLNGMRIHATLRTTLDVQARMNALAQHEYRVEVHEAWHSKYDVVIIDKDGNERARITTPADETLVAKINTLLRRFHSDLTITNKDKDNDEA